MILTISKSELLEKTNSLGKPMTGYEVSGTTPENTNKTVFVPDFKIKENSNLKIVSSLEIGKSYDFLYKTGGKFPELIEIREVDEEIIKKSKGKAKFKSESPETQRSIQRQNALTNATNLISRLIPQDIELKSLTNAQLEEISEIVITTAKRLMRVHDE